MAKSTKKSSAVRRELSSGGVIFKKVRKLNPDEVIVLWLLINPKDTQRWQLPKGRLKKSENAIDAAVREVEEETGVKIKVLSKVGVQRYFYYVNKQKTLKFVTFYLMRFVKETNKGHDKKEIDKVKLLEYRDASEKLSFQNDKDILKLAKEMLERGIME
jgi:8-oxo-dGTP pyrophosphatase MutT (NUDIX family)